MIRNTFIVLDGIGEKTEQRLWKQGVLTWDDFLNRDTINGFSTDSKAFHDHRLSDLSSELSQKNAPYLARAMKRREHWRLYEEFSYGLLCLDIETNGLRPGSGGFITVVGLYDGFKSTTLVRGENLTTHNLKKAVHGYTCLITFFGAVFDVPFLAREFPDVMIEMPHFDLCFAARRVNIQGGLKKLERMFDIHRDSELQGLNGYDAVMLWDEYRKGSAEAGEILFAYNKQDTRSLYDLADILYQRLKLQTGIDNFLPGG